MNDTSPHPYTLDRVVRMVISTISIIGILFLIKYLSSVLIPFFIAVFIVYLLNPLVLFFQNRMRIRKRILAVLITLILLVGSLIILSMLLIPQFINEMIRMANLIHAYITQVDYKTLLPGKIDLYLKDFLEKNEIEKYFNPENVTLIFRKASEHIWSFVTGSFHFLSAILGLMIIFLYVSFLLVDFNSIDDNWPNLIPEKHRSLAKEIVNDLKEGMDTYFRAQGLIALIVGVLFSIGFSIIGLPLAIMIGMFIGFLNLVPYLQLAGLIPALLLALLKALETGHTFWHEALLVIIVVSVVQLIQDLYLTPKIMGKAYGLNPAMILLSLSIWGSLLGFIGLLLALPLTTIVISYYKRFVLHEAKIIQTESNTEPKLGL